MISPKRNIVLLSKLLRWRSQSFVINHHHRIRHNTPTARLGSPQNSPNTSVLRHLSPGSSRDLNRVVASSSSRVASSSCSNAVVKIYPGYGFHRFIYNQISSSSYQLVGCPLLDIKLIDGPLVKLSETCLYPTRTRDRNQVTVHLVDIKRKIKCFHNLTWRYFWCLYKNFILLLAFTVTQFSYLYSLSRTK